MKPQVLIVLGPLQKGLPVPTPNLDGWQCFISVVSPGCRTGLQAVQTSQYSPSATNPACFNIDGGLKMIRFPGCFKGANKRAVPLFFGLLKKFFVFFYEGLGDPVQQQSGFKMCGEAIFSVRKTTKTVGHIKVPPSMHRTWAVRKPSPKVSSSWSQKSGSPSAPTVRSFLSEECGILGSCRVLVVASWFRCVSFRKQHANGNAGGGCLPHLHNSRLYSHWGPKRHYGSFGWGPTQKLHAQSKFLSNVLAEGRRPMRLVKGLSSLSFLQLSYSLLSFAFLITNLFSFFILLLSFFTPLTLSLLFFLQRDCLAIFIDRYSKVATKMCLAYPGSE